MKKKKNLLLRTVYGKGKRIALEEAGKCSQVGSARFDQQSERYQ